MAKYSKHKKGILLGVEPPNRNGPPGVRPGFVSGTVFTTNSNAGGSHQLGSSAVCSENEFRCDDGKLKIKLYKKCLWL